MLCFDGEPTGWKPKHWLRARQFAQHTIWLWSREPKEKESQTRDDTHRCDPRRVALQDLSHAIRSQPVLNDRLPVQLKINRDWERNTFIWLPVSCSQKPYFESDRKVDNNNKNRALTVSDGSNCAGTSVWLHHHNRSLTLQTIVYFHSRATHSPSWCFSCRVCFCWFIFLFLFFFILLFGLCRWMGKSWGKKIEKNKKNFEKTKRQKKNRFKVYGFVFSSSNDRCICLCCFDNPAIVRNMLASASKSANWRQTASKTQRLAVDSFKCWMRNQILDILLFADVIIRQRNWIGDWWSSGWFIAWIFSVWDCFDRRQVHSQSHQCHLDDELTFHRLCMCMCAWINANGCMRTGQGRSRSHYFQMQTLNSHALEADR